MHQVVDSIKLMVNKIRWDCVSSFEHLPTRYSAIYKQHYIKIDIIVFWNVREYWSSIIWRDWQSPPRACYLTYYRQNKLATVHI